MLPIDSLIPDIVASLRRSPNLIVEAAPGAGKTTRVPPALFTFGGTVLVLEPRRIAARMAARRVAAEMGEEPGETVGYQVRFEDATSARTRLRFLTEGVLTRRMISDPELAGVSVVVLDEFHERSIETDLALALLRRLQKTKRPDLRIVIMSATLDTGPVARFLDDCPVLRSEGRQFDLTIGYEPYSAAALETRVASALESVIVSESSGHVLVFLPGAAEIRQAARACEALAQRHDFLITPLYGDLPPAEQDRAVQASSRRKVILSTNIAESSITIEGVRVVIDSGLARIASDSTWTGLPSLEVKRISKAAARQRAGRAGRTGAGRVVRLYTMEDFQRRADHDAPEILRRELSQMCLQLEAGGIHDPLELDWLDTPPASALAAAESLLDRLGARGEAAEKMARLPLHPRLARLVLDGGEGGCRVAALLSSGQRVQSSDLFHALDEPWDGRTRAVYDQLRRYSGERHSRESHSRGKRDDVSLARAVLAAFPDRVGRRRTGSVVLLSNGSSAIMANAPGEFIVAMDVEDRGDRPVIRLACPIEPEWLIDRAVDRSGVEWNRMAERVEAVSALVYDELVIDESRGGPIDDEQAANLLAAKVVEAGLECFVDREEFDGFLARVNFAGLGPLDEAEILNSLTALCYGLRSFADVRKAAAGLLPVLEQRVGARLLDELAPSRLQLPSGRQTQVHYERGKPPWVASRLQDFFGIDESPRVGRDKVPLVIHLLAPNQRPVQTTTDLAGFWQRLYPQLRKELGRRYPKHAWPEKPV
ncbi:MAG: ATP-dependent helicase HrpB [Bryobacteraceae bacterium]